MSLNPGGNSNYSWNYSNPDRDEYSLELTGTVVAMQEVQARDFNPNSNQPGRPSFWPDGNPKMNIRVAFATEDGRLKSVTFMKAGKKQVSGEKPSLHMQLFGLTNGNMMDLMGKTVHLWTWPANPNTNQAWGQGNPRLFGVEEVPGAKYELKMTLPDEFKVPELYANDAVQGGQPVAPAPSQMQVPQAPPMQGAYYAAPTAQPMQQAQPYPFTPQQPAQFQPAQHPSAVQAMPPQQAQPVQGVDPAIAQAMKQAGVTNVQVTEPNGTVYDEEIPF